MKRILSITIMLIMLTSTSFAFSTSILRSDLGSKGVVPTVDGINDLNLQKNINSIFRNKGDELIKLAGGRATLSYEVVLNKPTIFSVIMKAVGNTTVYQGVNIDVTSGKEMELKDFFYLKDGFSAIVPTQDSVVLDEDGILLAPAAHGPYTNKISYDKILQYINISDGARILPSYKLTEEASEKTLELKTGEMVAIYLRSNPTTGFDWMINDSTKKIPGLIYMGDSFILPVNDRSGMTGVPGTKIFVISFEKPGYYKVPLDYRRAWVQGSANKVEFNFLVK